MKMINEFTMCPEIQLFSVHNKNSEKLLSLCLPVFPHCHTYINSSIILSFQFSIQRWKAEERLAILLQSVYGTREISIPYIIILFKIEFSKSWNIGLRTKQCYWSFTFRDKWLRWWPAHVRMLNIDKMFCKMIAWYIQLILQTKKLAKLDVINVLDTINFIQRV